MVISITAPSTIRCCCPVSIIPCSIPCYLYISWYICWICWFSTLCTCYFFGISCTYISFFMVICITTPSTIRCCAPCTSIICNFYVSWYIMCMFRWCSRLCTWYHLFIYTFSIYLIISFITSCITCWIFIYYIIYTTNADGLITIVSAIQNVTISKEQCPRIIDVKRVRTRWPVSSARHSKIWLE